MEFQIVEAHKNISSKLPVIIELGTAAVSLEEWITSQRGG